MSYSEIVVSHFWSPRNNRVDKEANAVGVAGVPGDGPFMVLYLRLDGTTIRDASFQTHGCAPSIAAGSLLATELPGTDLRGASAKWTEAAINAALGDLPVHKRHCSELAAEALMMAARGAADRRGKGEA